MSNAIDGRPDSYWDAPPEGDEFYTCPECGKKIKDASEELADCVDHLPIEVLPEVCELSFIINGLYQDDEDERVTVGDYKRITRALGRAVEAWKDAIKSRQKSGGQETE